MTLAAQKPIVHTA